MVSETIRKREFVCGIAWVLSAWKGAHVLFSVSNPLGHTRSFGGLELAGTHVETREMHHAGRGTARRSVNDHSFRSNQ
jgi:hypothetical protein